MKRLIEFFKKPLVIGLLILLLLALLIWFLGPLIAIGGAVPLENPITRLILIVLLVLAWGINNMRQQKKDQATDAGLAQAAAGGASAESQVEVAQLQARFEEALETLRRASLKDKNEKNFLYALPWYAIIGPPGSGKTTALINSGLDFPLADRLGREPIRGVGGTRNCDWWFTNEAVLLDTAGRFTAQDDEDGDIWRGFLDLLKKFRPRQPLNGVVVAISLAELLTQNEHERNSQLLAIRQRVQEMNERLELQLPIYMVFTKCDLVAGFNEFFDDLSREERAQTWGITFPVLPPEQNVLRQFGSEFDALTHRLSERVLTRVQHERDATRRGLIFGFPQQMASLRDTLERWLGEAFSTNRFHELPMLRGVYFTSATQQGAPIDLMLDRLSLTLGLDRKTVINTPAQGRSFFLNRLLTEVIFAESAMAGTSQGVEHKQHWLRRGVWATAVTLLATGAGLWGFSYTRNAQYVEEMTQRTSEYQTKYARLPREAGLDQELAALNSLRGITQVYGRHREDHPLMMQFGLYQGNTLGKQADAAYQHMLLNILFPHVVRRVEQQVEGSSSQPDFLREALNIYLMLGEPRTLDKGLLRTWMGLDWQNTLPNDSPKQQQLLSHLDSLLTGPLPPVALNQPIIAKAQQILCATPLSQQVYADLRSAAVSSGLKDFHVEALGELARKLFVSASGAPAIHSVPALYTHDGFYQVYLKDGPQLTELSLQKSATLCRNNKPLSPEELAQLKQDVEHMYQTDYVRHWKALLTDTGLRPVHNIGQIIETITQLTGPNSPGRELLKAANKNTALSQLPAGLPGAATAQQSATNTTQSLAKLFRQDGKQISNIIPGQTFAKAVESEFKPIQTLVSAPAGQAPRLDSVFALLNELRSHLDQLASSADAGAVALQSAGNMGGMGGGDIMSRIQMAAKLEPLPVQRWMMTVSQGSRGGMISQAKGKLGDIMKSELTTECKRSISNRYPLYRNASQETSLEDFARFFGPGGTVDMFIQNKLRPFIEIRDGKMYPLGGDAAAMPISAATLKELNRALYIKEAFFRAGQLPSVPFSLKPLFLDENVGTLLFEMDGQPALNYRHGPTRYSSFQWPGAPGQNQVRVMFEELGGQRFTINKDGPWALFRLLDHSRLTRRAADQFEATFTSNGHQARLELKANSVVNPFNFHEWAQFRCPEKL